MQKPSERIEQLAKEAIKKYPERNRIAVYLACISKYLDEQAEQSK